jgi:hypothetical protein
MLLAPEDTVSMINAKLPELMRRYCMVATTRADGRYGRGTAAFAQVGGEHYLLTAAHVVDGLGDEGLTLFLHPTTKNDEPLMHAAAAPREFPVTPEIKHIDRVADVAILSVPDPVRGANISYFMLEDAVETEEWLYANWQEFNAGGNGSLPYIILGYPNFATLDHEESRTQTTCSVPLQGYLTQWDQATQEPPRGTASVPQVHLELEAYEPEEPRSDLTEFEKFAAARLFKDFAEDWSPFGGFSGGPVVLLTPSKDHLIATVKEGQRIFGSPRAVCTAVAYTLREAGLTDPLILASAPAVFSPV